MARTGQCQDGSNPSRRFDASGTVDPADVDILRAAFGVTVWPMEERIKAAMVQGGYPPISVSQQVQEALR